MGHAGRVSHFDAGFPHHTVPFNIFGEGIHPTNPAATSHFSVSTLSAESAAASLQALESDTNTKILARPKVLTLDNERAVIKSVVNQAIGFLTTTTGTQGQTQTAQAERHPTGLILVVTPQVNENRRITLLVEPSVTKVVTSTLTPPSNLGNTVLDPKTRSARAIVRIKEGQTLVLGGLIDNSNEETEKRVPIISSIPLIGAAFRDKEVTRSDTELIVFLTPRILEDADGMAAIASQPSMLREQELLSSGVQEDAIEHSLDSLEKRHRRSSPGTNHH